MAESNQPRHESDQPLELTAEELIAVTSEQLNEDDAAFILADPQDYDRNLNYIIGRLLEEGIEDPAQYLRERAIVEEAEPEPEITIIVLRRFEDQWAGIVAGTHIPPNIAEEWRGRLENGEMTMVLALDQERPIGRANVVWAGAELAVTNEVGVVPMVNALHVEESYKHKGIGTRLMKSCEYVARDHESGVLALGVEPDNEPARKLYEKLGYQYRQVAGQTTYFASWEEDRPQGRVKVEAECMLMVKQLAQ